MTVNKLIKLLEEMKKQGYGKKDLLFDNTYRIAGIKYDEKEDKVEVF